MGSEPGWGSTFLTTFLPNGVRRNPSAGASVRDKNRTAIILHTVISPTNDTAYLCLVFQKPPWVGARVTPP